MLSFFEILVAIVSFSRAVYSVEENIRLVTISVMRSGDTERLAVVLVASENTGTASGIILLTVTRST